MQELIYNNSPCFAIKDLQGHLQIVGAALGPPPEGVFPSKVVDEMAHSGTGILLKDRLLPSRREFLDPLRLLSLRCLSWAPRQRPSAKVCSDQIASWVAAGFSVPSFAEQWQEHATKVRLHVLGPETLPGSADDYIELHLPRAADDGTEPRQPAEELVAAGIPSPGTPAPAATKLSPGNETALSAGFNFSHANKTPEPVMVLADVSAAVDLPSSQPDDPPDTAASALQRSRASPHCCTAPVPPTTFLKGYESDETLDSDMLPVLPVCPGEGGNGTAEPAPAAAANVLAPAVCTCDRKRHCGRHGTAPCTNTAAPGFSYCDQCRCTIAGCAGKQLRKTGYCIEHIFRTASPELQLTRALGKAVAPELLEEALVPADIQVLSKVVDDYIGKHKVLDPVFQLVAAWLKDPSWIETWSNNSLPCSSRPEDLVKALHQTIRDMSGRHDPEAAFNLRSGRGLGFSTCCFQLKVAAKVKPGAAEPVCTDDLVYNIGSRKATWRLLTDLACMSFFLIEIIPCAIFYETFFASNPTKQIKQTLIFNISLYYTCEQILYFLA